MGEIRDAEVSAEMIELNNQSCVLLRNSCCRLKRNEFETHRFGFGPKFDFLPLLMA